MYDIYDLSNIYNERYVKSRHHMASVSCLPAQPSGSQGCGTVGGACAAQPGKGFTQLQGRLGQSPSTENQYQGCVKLICGESWPEKTSGKQAHIPLRWLSHPSHMA